MKFNLNRKEKFIFMHKITYLYIKTNISENIPTLKNLVGAYCIRPSEDDSEPRHCEHTEAICLIIRRLLLYRSQ